MEGSLVRKSSAPILVALSWLLTPALLAPALAQGTKSPIEGVLQDISANPPQAAIGNVIEDICPSGNIASADLQARCNDLVLGLLRDRNVAGAQAALQAMAPEENAVVGSSLVDTAVTQLDAVAARLEALRRGTAGSGVRAIAMQWNGRSATSPDLLGPGTRTAARADAIETYAADPRSGFGAAALANARHAFAQDPSAAPEPEASANRWGLFVSGNLQTGDREATPSESGFDFDTFAFTVGADYRVSEAFVFGFAVGAENEESNLAANGGSLDTDTLKLSIQAAFYPSDRTFVELIAGAGSSDLEQQRAIRYSLGGFDIDQIARGDTEADQTFGSLAFGVDLGPGGWTITPELRADYLGVDVNGFAETMSNPAAPGSGLGLNIGAQEFNSLTSGLGLQASFAKSTSWGVLVPQFSAEWIHEFANDAETISGHFVGDPTRERFFLRNDDPVEDYGTVGVGLLAMFSSGRSFYVYYETLVGYDHLNSQNLGFGLRFEL